MPGERGEEAEHWVRGHQLARGVTQSTPHLCCSMPSHLELCLLDFPVARPKRGIGIGVNRS